MDICITFLLMLSVVSLYRCKCLEDTVLSEVTKDVLMQMQWRMARFKTGGITAKIVQRRRLSKRDSVKQRSYQYSYAIKTGTETVAVCREAYASIHGNGARRVLRIAKAVGNRETPMTIGAVTITDQVRSRRI